MFPRYLCKAGGHSSGVKSGEWQAMQINNGGDYCPRGSNFKAVFSCWGKGEQEHLVLSSSTNTARLK
jgi:hypothetical protein